MDFLQQLRHGSSLHLKLLLHKARARSWTTGAGPAFFTHAITARFGWDPGLIPHHNPIIFISWRLSFFSFPYPRVLRPSSHSLGRRVALSPQGLGVEWALLAADQHGLLSLRKELTPELQPQNTYGFLHHMRTTPRWPDKMVSEFPWQAPERGGDFPASETCGWEDHNGRTPNTAPSHPHHQYPWGMGCVKPLFLKLGAVPIIPAVLRGRWCGLYHGPDSSEGRARTRSQSKAMWVDGQRGTHLPSKTTARFEQSPGALCTSFIQVFRGSLQPRAAPQPPAGHADCKLLKYFFH